MKSGATSDLYLESILQDVPLHQIREIERSCHFDENNLFCAVLSKVSDPRLQDKYGDGTNQCNYLLEVWSQGELLFQRPLKNKIRVWNSSRQNNSIIYLLSREDEELDEGGRSFIHIVSLNKACNMTKIIHDKDELMEKEVVLTKLRDWTGVTAGDKSRQMHFALDKSNILYCSSAESINAVSLDDLRLNDQVVSLNADTGNRGSSDVLEFGPKTRFGTRKFDSDFRLLILYDTEQSFQEQQNSVCGIWERQTILDYNQIVHENDPNDSQRLQIMLVQTEEYKPQKDNAIVDQIKDIRHIQLFNNKCVTVVLSWQGRVDLYWNNKRIASSEEFDKGVSDIDRFKYSKITVNFNNVIMWRERKGNNTLAQHPVLLSLEQEQRTSFTDIVILPEFKDADLAFFKNNKYRNLIKPFQEVLYYQKSLLVAHGNILSYYDTLKEKWICHHKFEDGRQDLTQVDNLSEKQSFALFMRKKVVSVFRHEAYKENTFGIGVLFQDGTIEKLSLQQDENGHETMHIMPRTRKIDGNIISITGDREHGRILYVISEIEERKSDTLIKKEVKLWGFAQGELYDLTPAVQGVVRENTKVIPYFSPASKTQVIIMQPDENFFRIYENEVVKNEEGKRLITLARKKKIYVNNLQEKIDAGSIHHAFSTKNEEFLILIDSKNMYVLDTRQMKLSKETGGYNIPEEKFFVHKDRNIKGVQLIEDRYLYVLHNKVQEQQITASNTGTPQQKARNALLSSGNGVAMMDLSSLFVDPEKKARMIPICSAVVGCNDQIVYSDTNQKLVILTGFQRLRIIPMLHQNLMHFQQQKERENYLFARQTKDRFSALSKDGKIYEWCMQTGKLIDQALLNTGIFKTKYDSYDFNISEMLGHEKVENSEFEVFRAHDETSKISLQSQGVFPHTLLMMKEENTQMNDKDFYGRRLRTKKDGQKLYFEAMEKKFHTFVVIGLSQDDKIEIKTSFVFPKIQGRDQSIFISQDCSKILEICDDKANVYCLEKVDDKDLNCIECQARLDFQVNRLPLGIYDRDPYQLFCLFAPNLESILDIDTVDSTFIVIEASSGDTLFKIPDTFLTFNRENKRKIMIQTRFMSWHSQDELALIDINADPPIEEIIRIPAKVDGYLKVQEQKKSYQITSAVVPFLDIAQYQESYIGNQVKRPVGVANYFESQFNFDKTDTISRLKRKHRILKTIWYNQTEGKNIEDQIIHKQDQDAPGFQGERHEDLRHLKIYKELFSVDFVNDPENYMIETSFTFINWRTAELIQQLCQDTSTEASNLINQVPLSQDLAQSLCLSILPQCETIMHMITRNFEFCEYFCSIASAKDENGIAQFHIPFNDNIQGQTPLHLSLIEGPTQNVRTAEFFLKDLLQDMPLDHHGRAIVKSIPLCIQREISYTGEYMDSRFVTTKQFQKVSRVDKKRIKVDDDTIDEGYYVTSADLWPDQSQLIDGIFDNSESGAEIKVTCLDLPKLHDPNEKVGQDFMKSLSEVEDIDIMQYDSIRAITQFKWKPCYEFIFRNQLMPYCIYFVLYFVYSIYLMNKDELFYIESEKPEEDIYPISFKIFTRFWIFFMLCFSAYFLKQELRQFNNQGSSYFGEIWNFADVIPPLIIITVCLIDGFTSPCVRHESMGTFRYSCQAVASFGMWIKIFYFLRIFRQTGFFVNMFFAIAKAAKTFFFLYVLILLAFASSFAIMTPAGDSHFIIISALNYAFMLGLGEFGDMDWEADFNTPVLAQIFFILATLVVLIVMLNILIALVSSAYEDVIERQQQANDFERASLIADTAEFIKGVERYRVNEASEYLIKAQITNFKKQVSKNDEEQ